MARTPGCRLRRLGPFFLLLTLLCGWMPAGARQPAELLRGIRSTKLDPDRAVSLGDVTLELGEARLEVGRGVLIPSEPIGGRTVELVFIGQARFRIDAPDEIEAGQLELFTGERALDAAIDAAVIVVADQTTVSRLLDRQKPRDLGPTLLARAEAVRQAWLVGAERQAAGVEAALFKVLMEDSAFSRYLAVWCRGFELNDFIYELDPEDNEPLTLASFMPLDVSGWDRRRLERHLRIQQRKGRWLGMRVQDLGAWDVWLSAPWVPRSGPRFPGNVGFEAEHYELDVRIEPNSFRLDGTARLRLTAEDDGRRAVTLDLFRDLRVRRVRDGAGRDLFFFRSGGDVLVALEEPSRKGETLELEVRYGGRALKWVGRKVWDLEDTAKWYPHCGSIDRATYDVKLSWPKKLDLLASGRLVAEGRRGRYRWEHRVLDQPAIAFSFALGRFLVEKRKLDDVELTVAISHNAPYRLTESLRREILDTVNEALDFFENTYGPYPLGELTIVIIPRTYSQSYLGFITLTDGILPPNLPPYGADTRWFRGTTVAHEIAHQWWGNLLGWWSYRDQWLSEAMANYSALLFYAQKEGRGSAFLAEMSGGWRESLHTNTRSGRTVESLGPVVLGGRLNSSLAGNGYRAIVYRKGAVVLAMLARAIGQEQFLKMLSSLVEVASNRVITTEDFIESIEHMSGLDLGGFARRYIYGTGIPQVYYDYELERSDGGWELRGEARLLAVPRYEQRIQREPSGRWDVRREPVRAAVDPKATLMVPFALTADGAVRNGRLFIEGQRDEFAIHSETEPDGLTLDPRGEILARFYELKKFPKRVARYRAMDLALEGKWAAAEASYRRALSEEPDPGDPQWPLPWMADPSSRARNEDARIHLALARMYLDQQRDADAEVELLAAEALVGSDRTTLRMERDALWARLEIARFDYESAFKRLKKALRLAAPRRERLTWRQRIWQAELSSDWLATTDVFALLAITAHEMGKPDELRWALQGARDRGVDVTALEGRLAERPVRSP